MSLGPLYVLLGEVSVQVLCHFLIGLFAFLDWFIYSFIERGEGREKERERNINVWWPLARPY